MKVSDNVRITSDRALSHTMQTVLAGVDNNPGTGFKELYIALNLPSNTVASALYRLADRGRIQKVRLDGALRYYPSNYKLSDEVVKTRTFFRCSECGKEFKQRRSMTMHHTRMHTGIDYHKPHKRTDTEVVLAAAENLKENTSRAMLTYITEEARLFVWETESSDLRRFVEWLEHKQ